ncbi:hypothetical protein KAU25_04020 [Candidatus Bathyarchaeota archaeon]|nr:hypothetical protein [Candidatus Bathyarchaeota archaeon]
MADDKQIIDVSTLSPKAQKLLQIFAKTSGYESLKRVVEELGFSILELLELIDTSRDPSIYPQDAVLIMTTVKANLARFTRFGEPTKLMNPDAKDSS